MGECEPCAPRELWGGGGARGKDLGSRAPSLSDLALEVCLLRALGPACAEWREGVLPTRLLMERSLSERRGLLGSDSCWAPFSP